MEKTHNTRAHLPFCYCLQFSAYRAHPQSSTSFKMQAKIVNKESINVWKCPTDDKFTALAIFVMKSIGLFYIDDEGDCVAIQCDSDVDDFFQCDISAQSKKPKIYVGRPTENSKATKGALGVRSLSDYKDNAAEPAEPPQKKRKVSESVPHNINLKDKQYQLATCVEKSEENDAMPVSDTSEEMSDPDSDSDDEEETEATLEESEEMSNPDSDSDDEEETEANSDNGRDKMFNNGVMEDCMKLLRAGHEERGALLTIMGNMLSGSEAQTQAVIDAGYLDVVETNLDSMSASQQKEVLRSLSNIMRVDQHLMSAVLSRTKLLRFIADAAQSAPLNIRLEACHCIAHASFFGTAEDCAKLRRLGALKALRDIIEPENGLTTLQRKEMKECIDCLLWVGPLL